MYSIEDLKNIEKEKIADWWLSKLTADHEELKKKIEGMKIEEIHTKECEYQRQGCDCGYEDRCSYNYAISNILKLL